MLLQPRRQVRRFTDKSEFATRPLTDQIANNDKARCDPNANFQGRRTRNALWSPRIRF